MPTAAATARAPSSSPVARAGETAVTASARSPSTRAAAAATSEESTPPENATSALGALAIVASRSSSAGIELLRLRGRGEGLGPDLLDRPAGHGGDCGAIVVLGGDVHTPALEQPDLDTDRVPADVNLADGTIELVALEALHANPERRGVRKKCLGELPFVRRPAEDAEHDAGAALLHVDGDRPGVDGAGGRARPEDVGHELGNEVIDVGLEQHDRRVTARLGHGVADRDADEVGAIRVFAAAEAGARRAEHHRRKLAPRVGGRHHYGGAGRRDELAGRLDADDRDPG